MPSRTAFTLVELLVVISIVVVLLALLAPALDRAVYQAELATCAAKLDAVGCGLTAGAVQYQRRYPERLAHYQPIGVNLPAGAPAASGGADDRPTLRGYLQSPLNKLLNDPLAKPVDIDGSKVTTTVQTSYAMWFGWQLASQRSMRKLGDRWTAKDAGADGVPNTPDDVLYSLDVLAQDYELRTNTGPNLYSSHVDRDYALRQFAVTGTGGTAAMDISVQADQTTSTWTGLDGTRGLLDLNIGYADGAVARFADVSMHPGDDRFIVVSRAWNGGYSVTDWCRAPKP